MVPKGWSSVQAQDVCKSISVGVVIKPTQYYVPEGYGVKAFRSANVREGFINDSDWVYFSHEGHAINKKSHLKTGDVLIVRTGYPGTACVVTPEFEGSNAIDIVIARPDMDKIIPEYLCAYTNSHIGKSQVLDLQGGMAQKHLNVGAYQVLKINLPPLCEQKKIAQILLTWDNAISVTEKLLANSQRQKKALMQQLLTGNKRLLDENGVRFSGEWKITKLIQMGKVVSGGTPDTNMAMYWEGDILWLTPTDVTALTGRFVSNTSRKITPAGLLNSSAVLLPKGSLMVCTRATIGALAISTSEICTNQGFKNIIPNEGFNIEFIYYLLQMNTNEMIKKSSGSTFLELSKKDFETLSFSCPFIKEQQKIAAVLSAADTEISTLEKKLACLKDEKKALMQQLLTGKRRVKVDEAVAA
ncbi:MULTISPECIES: restriction endonuclease subunit S [Klebsiella/Raoultella group]|uniref:Restriction endonuclease subunit S n=1 Tax=Raoultella planticola TaxID=575 RepID=A0A443VDQ2_RAOPL|nr:MULTISPECIES: restriction endonuclease subunit S [Klebsiella/Raoultella group]EKP1133702.1 restriction endonuclease subunit S [Klebsiella michiganensis]EKU8634740.1 restriction endonuclease subunit S [Raoultella ornithinolytica]ELT0603342.1 restriction endonuclease subunit S [Raoultella ornithinolytica]ELT0734391.1 restriction endonuclease subunit S [Raoultella ornithinolytica]KAB7488197.1 restriction endonuclease subunit S [Klebsiella michiganensis]